MSKIVVTTQDNSINLEFSKDTLKEFLETHDGFEISLKNGILLRYENPYYPTQFKNVIKHAVDNMTGDRIIITLDHPSKPVRVELG